MGITFLNSGLTISDNNPGSVSLTKAVEAAWNRLPDAIRAELSDGWRTISESRGHSATRAYAYTVDRAPLPHAMGLEIERESLGDHAVATEAVMRAVNRSLGEIRAARPRTIGDVCNDAPACDLWTTDETASRFAKLIA